MKKGLSIFKKVYNADVEKKEKEKKLPDMVKYQTVVKKMFDVLATNLPFCQKNLKKQR